MIGLRRRESLSLQWQVLGVDEESVRSSWTEAWSDQVIGFISEATEDVSKGAVTKR